MAMRDHIEPIDRTGVLITYVDPSKRIINAKNKQAGDITIPVTSTPPLFRWPVVGEKWVVRRENGSWVLDGLWSDPLHTNLEQAQPGDAIIASPTGVGYIGKRRILAVATTPVVTGSRASGAALTSLLATLATAGILIDNTTP